MSERQPERGLSNVEAHGRITHPWVECFPPLQGNNLSLNHLDHPKAISLKNLDQLPPPRFTMPDLTACPWGLPELAAVANAVGCADVYAVSAASGEDQLALAVEIAAACRRMGRSVLIITKHSNHADQLVCTLKDRVDKGTLARLLVACTEAEHTVPESIASLAAAAQARHRYRQVEDSLIEEVSKAREAFATITEAWRLSQTLQEQTTKLQELKSRPIDPPQRPDQLEQTCQQLHQTLAERTEAFHQVQAEWDAQNQANQRITTTTKLLRLIGLIPTDPTCEQLSEKCALLRKETEELMLTLSTKQADLQRELEAYELARFAWEEYQQSVHQTKLEIETAEHALQALLKNTQVACDTLQLKESYQQAQNRLDATQRQLQQLQQNEHQLTQAWQYQFDILVTANLRAEVPMAFDTLLITNADAYTLDELEESTKQGERSVFLGNADDQDQPSWFKNFVTRHANESWARDQQQHTIRLLKSNEETYEEICEPLADQPEIKLHFQKNRSGLEIAAVTFPPSFSASQAIEFLAKELDFVRMRHFGPKSIIEEATTKRVVFSMVEAFLIGSESWIDLGDGVSQLVTDGGWTAAIRFPQTWTTDQIEQYLEANSEPATRAARLPQPLFIPERSMDHAREAVKLTSAI